MIGRVILLSLVILCTYITKADAAPVRCQEDAPCWNWRTMGNHKRGIVTKGGRKLVVSSARFDRMIRNGNIDWCNTEYVNGDYR